MTKQKWEREVMELLDMPSAGTATESKQLIPDFEGGGQEALLFLYGGGQSDRAIPLSRETGSIAVTSHRWLSLSNLPVSQVEDRIKMLEVQVAALEKEVKALKQATLEEQEGEVTVLRTIPREQAKQEIRQLFTLGEILYYSDIVQRLGLDISLVIDLCRELEVEGEVTTLANAT